MTAIFVDEAIDQLQANFRGELIRPGHPSYDEARRVRNGLIDRCPAVIARCSGSADVVAAVNFARDNDLLLSVRGGGHNVSGAATNDSGIVIDSKVSAFDPPRLLEYSWSGPGEPERPLRWELEPEDGGTRLALTVSILDNEDIARTCAGWEAHLMMLHAALEGVPMKFPFDRFKATREQYKAMVAALG